MAIDPIITESYFKPITNAATGRVAFEIQAGAGKTTVEVGDTGLRDVSGMFDAGKVTSGRLLVQRIGNTVTWTLAALNFTAGVTSVWSLMTSATLGGLMPPGSYSEASPVMQSKTEIGRFIVGNNNVAMHYPAAGVNYTGTLSYVTNKPWPTTLPGVADGQPVAV